VSAIGNDGGVAWCFDQAQGERSLRSKFQDFRAMRASFNVPTRSRQCSVQVTMAFAVSADEKQQW
jgi:hypothetical protein